MIAYFQLSHLFFNFEGFKIIEFAFMGLECTVDIEFAWSTISCRLKDCYYNENSLKITISDLWKITTLPPLSPVANSSPSWLNSTAEIISAEFYFLELIQVNSFLPSATSSSKDPFTWLKYQESSPPEAAMLSFPERSEWRKQINKYPLIIYPNSMIV